MNKPVVYRKEKFKRFKYHIAVLALLLVNAKLLLAQSAVEQIDFTIHWRDKQAQLAPFTDDVGYGFEFGSEKQVTIRQEGEDRWLSAVKPFYFSVKVPEGNYKVTIHYRGLPGQTYQSTVRAESRRLQLEQVRIPDKPQTKQSFNVHIKSPIIDDGTRVALKKPREVEKLDWDDKLTLEFQQTNAIAAIQIETIPNVTCVFLAGNSTVVNQEDEPWASWGQMIPRFFDQTVVVANHAESGLALSSFLTSNRLQKILSVAQPGDYLFIEFGHNDQKETGEKSGAYQGYSDRLRLFVEAFRSKGGIPVLVTSTERRFFDEKGVLNYTLGDYPAAVRQVAKELHVPLIDLNKITRTFYTALGVENSKKAFVHYPANTFPRQPEPLQDNTHFNTYGAYQIAKMVLQGIQDASLKLQDHMVDFTAYDPSYPDAFASYYWPPSIKQSERKPDGN